MTFDEITEHRKFLFGVGGIHLDEHLSKMVPDNPVDEQQVKRAKLYNDLAKLHMETKQ